MRPLTTVKTQTAPLTGKHPLYPRWRTIINRCFNPKSVNYPRYGARGITVCDRWLSFPLFVEDMGIPELKSLQIDRIDNAKGYSPENCRWVSPKQNSLNRTNNVVFSHDGMTKTVSEWAEYSGIRVGTLHMRLFKYHMPIEVALTRDIRAARGNEYRNRTVLTDNDAQAIKHSSEPLKVVATRYGVSLSTISGIRTGAIWKHIT